MVKGHDMDLSGWVTWLGHTVSGVAIIGTIVGWFPAIAATLAAVWYCIQIYESNLFQRWLKLRTSKKIAALRAEIKRLEEWDREDK
jgi:hypothetical protein